MSHRSVQKGFAIVETLLVVVILALVGFIGWYIWHVKTNTDKAFTHASLSSAATSTHTVCQATDKSYTGRVFIAPGGTYKLCEPNGWLLYTNGDAKGSSIIANANNLVYQLSKAASAKGISGTDGSSAFGIFYNINNSSVPIDGFSNFIAAGSFKAMNIVGNKYTRTQAVAPTEGLGSVPEGTQQYEYHFVKDNRDISVEYNVFPGDISRVPLVEAVVHTLELN